MGETHVVAAELFCPAEQGVDVFLGVRATSSIGSFGVDGYAAKEDRLSVEKDLSALSFDGAEADLVGDFVCVGFLRWRFLPCKVWDFQATKD